MSNKIQKKVINLISNISNKDIEKIHMHDILYTHCFDSLDMLTLLIELNYEFGIDIKENEFTEDNTIDFIVNLIENKIKERDEKR